MDVSISVVIFSKNDGNNIFATFDKVIQVMNDLAIEKYEIIFIDNGSTDETYKNMMNILNLYSKKNIKVFTETNQGISHAIKKGVSNSSFTNCLPIPGHDLWSKEAIKNVIKNTKVDQICLGYRSNKFKFRPIVKAITSKIYVKLVNLLFKTNFKDINGLISFPTLFLRNSLIFSTGHSHAVVPLIMAYRQKIEIVEVLAKLNESHKTRKDKNFSSNFPKPSHVISTLKGLIFLKAKL